MKVSVIKLKVQKIPIFRIYRSMCYYKQGYCEESGRQGQGDDEIITSGSLLLSMPAGMLGSRNQEGVVADYVCSGLGRCAGGVDWEFQFDFL